MTLQEKVMQITRSNIVTFHFLSELSLQAGFIFAHCQNYPVKFADSEGQMPLAVDHDYIDVAEKPMSRNADTTLKVIN